MTADTEDGQEQRAPPAQPAVIDVHSPAYMRTRLGALAIPDLEPAWLAVTGLPIAGVVLVVLLIGDAATSPMPVVIMAVVVAPVAGPYPAH